MPFVQRVVSPTYLSRSRPRSRAYRNGPGPRASSPLVRNPKAAAPGTSTGSGHSLASESAGNHVNGGAGNPGAHLDPRTSSSVDASDVLVNGTISSAAAGPTALGSGGAGSSTTGKSGSAAAVPLPAPLSIVCPTAPSPVVTGHEFESVTNITLSNALRQLASLVLIANDIFSELNAELQAIGERSKGIKHRIVVLEQNVERFDPKLVPVRKCRMFFYRTRIWIGLELVVQNQEAQRFRPLE